MTDKKYQIFISSTYQDLIGARDSITKSILDMYHIPIGMEMFSADNNEQWDTIKATIDNSDFYVLIIGHRYGSITKEGISYTEKEYNYAKEIGVPILTFIRNRDVPISALQRDKESSKKKKKESFIYKVSTDAMINYWNDQADLALKVSISLANAFYKYNRIGWIRAGKGTSPVDEDEKAILTMEDSELKNRLTELNMEVSRQKDNLVRINQHLEEIIEERTKDLQIKNRKLVEYSTFLSHQIRGPIATLKGLMTLEKEGLVDKPECIKLMNKCVGEIDGKIIEMSDMLHDPVKIAL
jgi:signal transduction histidine kinase